MELLAPAGDPSCLEAAVRARADSVYLGLRDFNARRRARNFSAEELREAVSYAHRHGTKVYLTLNTVFAERELPRVLEAFRCAADAGVDAVLVRDPAVLAIRKHLPQLPLHLSTQAGTVNSADVAAAAELGFSRVVLGREMSLEEIRATAAPHQIETEVFAQGALCFSVSGRCLMSSWVGGRSGNRGTCASPCRVPWTVSGEPAGNPLSMHDLCTLEQMTAIHQAGVTALKIEGRLKNARWVETAVSLYRRALDGEDAGYLAEQAARLADYTGRKLTAGFLEGMYSDLTGTDSGRLSSREDEATPFSDAPTDGDETPSRESPPQTGATENGRGFIFEILCELSEIRCRVEWGKWTAEWQYPKTRIVRPHKAIPVSQLLEAVASRTFHGVSAEALRTDLPDYLLVPRTANAAVERLAAEIFRAKRSENRQAAWQPPTEIEEWLGKPGDNNPNNRALGSMPNRVRLAADQVAAFVSEVSGVDVIVENADPEQIPELAAACRKRRLIIATPPVCFEPYLDDMIRLMERCRKARCGLEVNSWGAWHLARKSGMALEAGPGLAVLNSLAAGVLRRLGASCVAVSCEADRRQLESLSATCRVPMSLCVFGRPPLAFSRVELPPEYLEREFADRRGLRMIPRREAGIWTFRPVNPFDWRDLSNERIRARHLVVDLTASPDPISEWLDRRPRFHRFRFNYDRTLH
ncbi:peptidase U32 family protein [Thermopirellula anaerolimosa]